MRRPSRSRKRARLARSALANARFRALSCAAVVPTLALAFVLAAPPATVAPRETNVAKIYLLGAVHFYQHWISPADGASCGFYPTCSGYAVDALHEHGAVVGFVMTAERVMRNHGGASYPLVY